MHFDLNLSFCEDLYFNASLLLYPLRIAYLSRAFYHYVQNLNLNHCHLAIIKVVSNMIEC